MIDILSLDGARIVSVAGQVVRLQRPGGQGLTVNRSELETAEAMHYVRADGDTLWLTEAGVVAELLPAPDPNDVSPERLRDRDDPDAREYERDRPED